MNDRLLKAANTIRDMLAQAEASDIMKRYDVAVAIEQVRANAAYGKKAVQLLADHLGLPVQTCHDMANVAKRWPNKKAFEKLATKPGKFGVPLSWSHFIQFGREEDAKRRGGLLTKARDNGWTVEQLKAERKANASESDDETQVAPPKTERSSGVAKAMETVERELAVLKSEPVALGERLQRKIANASVDELPETMERLQSMKERVSKWYDAFDGPIEQIRLRLEHAAEAEGSDGSYLESGRATPGQGRRGKRKTRPKS
jgi:hypothetical protein